MGTNGGSRFQQRLLEVRQAPLTALGVATLQVNMGYRCNLACKHCHVEGGPSRKEMMDGKTVELVLRVLASAPVGTLDITGGAPELNPHFRSLVREARKLGKTIVARTNLTVFFEDDMADLPEFYRDHEVEVVASLPYYLEDDVDRVRGNGTFAKCINALRELNRLGYGRPDAPGLSLVYNPRGAFLSPGQAALEAEYKRELKTRFDISFSRLYVFTNMPIGRFREFLVRSGNHVRYLERLASSFNPATLEGVMCRHLLSVGWDGRLHDCDFNQVLGISLGPGAPAHIRDYDHERLAERTIEVGDHCFGCTAGAGSS